jgi:hypothetical protein
MSYWMWMVGSGVMGAMLLLWSDYRVRRRSGEPSFSKGWVQRASTFAMLGLLLGWGFLGVLPWKIYSLVAADPTSRRLGPPPFLPVEQRPLVIGGVVAIILLRAGFWARSKAEVDAQGGLKTRHGLHIALAISCWLAAGLALGGGLITLLRVCCV